LDRPAWGPAGILGLTVNDQDFFTIVSREDAYRQRGGLGFWVGGEEMMVF
jgi:hypothetical protein